MSAILEEIENVMDAFCDGTLLQEGTQIMDKFSKVVIKYETLIAQFLIFWKNSEVVDAALMEVTSEPIKKSFWSSLPYQPYKDLDSFKYDYIDLSKKEKLNMVDLYIMSQRLKQSSEEVVLGVKAYIKVRAMFVQFVNKYVYHVEPPSYEDALALTTTTKVSDEQAKILDYARSYTK